MRRGGGGKVPFAVNYATKTGAVALTYAWCVASNYWGTVAPLTYVPREPKSCTRLPNWPEPAVTFSEICFRNASGTFSDFRYAILVDGALAAKVQGTANQRETWHTIPLPTVVPNASLVQILDTWTTITGPQGVGDSQSEGGRVLRVATPQGYSITRGQSSTGIICVNDSILDCVLSAFGPTDDPEIMGATGLMRLDAFRHGWMVATLGTGGATATGDGVTPAQRAAYAVDVANAMGASTIKLVINLGHNDATNGTGTAAQVTAHIQALVDACPGSWEKHVVTPIPSSVATATVAAYSTDQVNNLARCTSIINGQVDPGIVIATDLFDGVHPNQATGRGKLYAPLKTNLGLT